MAPLDGVRNSLERVQNLDPKSVVRRDELGIHLNFEPAEPPIRKTKDLFTQIPLEQLDGLSQQFLRTIKDSADSFHSLIDEILAFDATDQNAAQTRQRLIDSSKNYYEQSFNQINPAISYIGSRQKDFAVIERDARAKIQQVVDRADSASQEIERQRTEAKQILEEIRNVAAEQGVSQQAHYFGNESGIHAKSASVWEKRIKQLAAIGIAYLIFSLFFTKISYIAPTNAYETAQLALSKTLIFAVIAYLLILSARNFLSHKHNAVVNKHRQNALLTYRALAEAAGSHENRDIVLAHAASCIFSPQDTGYTKASPQTNVTGLVESISKIVPPASHMS